ncbi:NAD(P)-binding protein [Favolaschia claudopus]|uniref:NAD(P)-binding protein n=1 Tax=Favolaschia claudopus TaxID=2862362 RepID=A0AAW0EJE7_9AGAR
MTISQDTTAPLVAVVGATGAQGGSVIQALIDSTKPYRIRGFTRDVAKPASQNLIKQGVEMIAVNIVLDNAENVFKAFVGANMAFLVTNFWEHLDAKKEIAEGKMMIDAVKAAGVERVVWSGLQDYNKISQGKYTYALHFDGKAHVTEYARQSGLPFFVDVQAGFYSENLVDPGRSSIKRRGDSFVLRWPGNPKSALPVLDAEHDYGLYVRHAFEATGTEVARLNGAAMYTGVYMTGEEISAQVSEATGKKITIESVLFEQYEKDFTAKGMPPHVGLDMRDAAQAVEEFGYYGGKDVFNTEAFTQRKPLSFIEFAKAADWSRIMG